MGGAACRHYSPLWPISPSQRRARANHHSGRASLPGCRRVRRLSCIVAHGRGQTVWVMTTQEAASNNEDAAPVQTRLTFFPQQRSSQQAGLLAAMAAILLVPAIWNGFPFVFPDTGGYLVRPFTGTLELGRSALYGAFLAAGIALDFWPNVIVQALIGAWTISLVLRMQGLRHPALQIAVVAALCVGTSLPWHAGQLEPDVFLPLAVLAVYLMAFAAPQLSRRDIALLAAVVAFAIAAHTSI